MKNKIAANRVLKRFSSQNRKEDAGLPEYASRSERRQIYEVASLPNLSFNATTWSGSIRTYFRSSLENFRTSDAARNESIFEASRAAIPAASSFRIKDLVSGTAAAVTLNSRRPNPSRMGIASRSDATSPQTDAAIPFSRDFRMTSAQIRTTAG